MRRDLFIVFVRYAIEYRMPLTLVDYLKTLIVKFISTALFTVNTLRPNIKSCCSDSENRLCVQNSAK